jgi:hypothetical protein
MAALTETGARTIHAATVSTTAETWGLTRPCKSLRVTNRDADPIFLTIVTSTAAITDDAGITVAVADADETYIVPGVLTSGSYQTRELWRSPRARFLAGSIVGNVSTYDIEGFDWY